jgi:hypothetical protein
MTVRIETREAKAGFNCVCCRERVRNCEKYIAVINNDTGRQVRGERYCLHCKEYAVANNEDDLHMPDDEYDSEAGLRQRERYAAYQAAGCTKEFWTDEDIMEQERAYRKLYGI